MRYISVLIFIFLSITLSAQCPQCPQRTPEEEAEKMTEMLCRAVGDITAAQKDSIHLIHLEMAQERMQCPQHTPDTTTIRRHMERIEHFLTPEQVERLRNRMPGRPRRGGGEPRMQGMPLEHRS